MAHSGHESDRQTNPVGYPQVMQRLSLQMRPPDPGEVKGFIWKLPATIVVLVD